MNNVLQSRRQLKEVDIMQFFCRLEHLPDGRWKATCEESAVGVLEVTEYELNKALEKMRKEIRYRIESQPEGVITDKKVELKIQ